MAIVEIQIEMMSLHEPHEVDRVDRRGKSSERLVDIGAHGFGAREALYREQRDTLALELERRAGADVTLDVPDHGMHIVAYLRHGRPDVALERAAAAHGVVARAISPLYTAAPPRSGLLLGFTGFASEAIAPAVARLAASFGDVARSREPRRGSRARRSAGRG